jgi:hypothetical protein
VTLSITTFSNDECRCGAIQIAILLARVFKLLYAYKLFNNDLFVILMWSWVFVQLKTSEYRVGVIESIV